MGLAAIQLAKHLGAAVAATTRTPAKVPALRAAGADVPIDTSREDWVAEIGRHWGPDAVAVVLDPVGAATVGGDLDVLATGGRIVCIATMSGAHGDLDLRRLMQKRARLVGSTLRARPRAEKARLVERFRSEVLPAFERGQLGVHVDAVYVPTQAAEGFQRMRDNQSIGKLLIDWRGAGALS